MTSDIARDLEALTSTITDPQTKPILRSTIALGLRDLGHDVATIDATLDDYYKETVH